MKRPTADYRDLYLIVIGLALGVMLGPGVLGRVAPAWYDRLFVGDASLQTAQEAVETFNKKSEETASLRSRLRDSGVTPDAIREFENRNQPVLDALRQGVDRAFKDREQRQERLRGAVTGLVLAVAGLMVLEVLAGETERARRIAWGRYAVMGLWVMVVAAQPLLLRSVSVGLAAGVVVMVMLVASVPMGRRQNR